MEEKTSQLWSQALSGIREKRHNALNNFHREHGANYSAKDFSDLAMESLEEALAKWWEFENKTHTAEGASEDVAAVTDEMASVVDFEVDAILRDLDSFEGAAAWEESDISKENDRLAVFAEQLKQNYILKIRSTLGHARPTEELSSLPPLEPPPTPLGGFNSLPTPSSSTPSRKGQASRGRVSGGSRSRGSGVALFLMFVLGLFLGSGPSFYFWDLAQKSQTSVDDQVSRLSSEKRALEDNLGIYQQNLSLLAAGKIKTIPQLEDAMQPIREDIAMRRRKVEREFTAKRESLMKRTSAGDLQDRAIGVLERNRDESLGALNAEQKTRLEPYLKQLQVLKELTEQR